MPSVCADALVLQPSLSIHWLLDSRSECRYWVYLLFVDPAISFTRRMWVDHYGDIEVNEVGTKRKAILKFTKCGWFSKVLLLFMLPYPSDASGMA